VNRTSEAGESNLRIVSELDAMARHHFSWITKSFVHVLILQEWGAREISTRIGEEYEREIPRCFRIVERILELGGCPSLEAGREAYVRHLPTAGRTVAKMLERERAMIEGFNDALDRSEELLAGIGEDEGSAIAKEAR
jgi:bacterioferritin (cytochrome b1)